MSSVDAVRFIEILLTHNEPVSCDDLACALGVRRTDVQALAIRLQTQGYVVVVDENAVAATPAANDYPI
jgi:biotin operon repressor